MDVEKRSYVGVNWSYIKEVHTVTEELSRGRSLIYDCLAIILLTNKQKRR